RGKIKLVITESTLVLSSDGVISESGELLETLLEAIANSLMDECLSIAIDVIYVDEDRVVVDRARKVGKQEGSKSIIKFSAYGGIVCDFDFIIFL
ncbi:hypothetical protein, partial [Candidatus Ichthyocystis sparus]|uniref:hypothetical protein n=1 Tax=Candidatus Ichthyocystis sparus TaxID=1561004 RepID=UPI000A769FBD